MCLILLSGIAGCAGNRAVSRPAAAVDSAQAERERAVDALSSWSFSGRIAVSDGRDGGSARIEWQQSTDRAEITLRAPVSGQTWKLSGDDASGWTLHGTRAGGVQGANAEALLLRETGWRLPFSALRRWLFGLRAGAGDEILLREGGLPSKLVSADGWSIEFVDYDESLRPALATRLRADRPPHKVRLAISTWQLP